MKPSSWVCAPLRPIEAVTKPCFPVPEYLCDSHMHVFGDLERYPAVPGARYNWPAASLEAYLDIVDRLGIRRVVFVQPSYYGLDNSCLIDAMRVVGRPCRGVIFLPDKPDGRELDALHDVGVRALRLDFFKAIEDGLSIDQMAAEIDRAARLAKPRGWHIELYSPGKVTHRLLDALARLDIAFSVNHFGYMAQADGMNDDHFTDFLKLVASSDCWVKFTAPYRLKPEMADRVCWMSSELIATAPDRMVWGTDWPHIPSGDLDTGQLFNRMVEWCPDPAVRERILVSNPARLYGFD